MTVTTVEITSRPTRPSTTRQPAPKTEPAGLIITSIDALTSTNQRGCGNDNPYN
jgi:hypothetical protein